MASDLKAFLERHKTEKGQAFTHTAIPDDKRKGAASYYIADADSADFLRIYIAALREGDKPRLTEKHVDDAPVLIDLDFRQPSDARLYDAAWLADFVAKIAGLVQEHVVADTFTVYVLEKGERARSEKGKYKDGIHIIIPDVITVPAVQLAIREAFLERHGASAFARWTNKPTDVYDEAVIAKNNWLLYGSRKHGEAHAWTYTHRYLVMTPPSDSVHGTITRDDTPMPVEDLVPLFSIRNKGLANDLRAPGHAAVAAEEKSKKSRPPPPPPAATHPLSTLPSVSNADPVVKLLNCLSKARFDAYPSWRDVATALKNTHGDTYKGEWLRLSRTSPKFDEAEALRLWDSVARPEYGGERIGMGTLCMWAREDDLAGYVAYKVAVIPPIVHELWETDDRGLARIAHHLLKDKVKRCGKKTAFYCFDDDLTAWIKCDESRVRFYISDALEGVLRELDVTMSIQLSQLMDDKEKERLEKQRAKLGGMIKYIRCFSGLVRVASLAGTLFDAPDFEQQMDAIPHLLGVRNGVVDLRTGQLRARRPEDGIYNILDVEYDPLAATDVMDAAVLSAMADDPEMAAYLQKLVGYGITGETSEEIFPVFTGAGR